MLVIFTWLPTEESVGAALSYHYTGKGWVGQSNMQVHSLRAKIIFSSVRFKLDRFSVSMCTAAGVLLDHRKAISNSKYGQLYLKKTTSCYIVEFEDSDRLRTAWWSEMNCLDQTWRHDSRRAPKQRKFENNTFQCCQKHYVDCLRRGMLGNGHLVHDNVRKSMQLTHPWSSWANFSDVSGSPSEIEAHKKLK